MKPEKRTLELVAAEYKEAIKAERDARYACTSYNVEQARRSGELARIAMEAAKNMRELEYELLRIVTSGS